ncbi:glycosyltransferase family 2 protein [Comamonas sp. MYb396]|uniref:glycosyltransferase family 2 protein n=1 Tax=Comamonas sp. MYb396 TaxID=2745302 RepID=UPI0030B15044
MPIVSIIIPTARRPDLLHRAIESCLVGIYKNETEVLVIANGPDISWKKTADLYENDSRVIFHYSCIADQNNARNIGIALAKGDIVRFLDDDDYLMPIAASNQYKLMQQHDLDWCAGGISIVDEEDHTIEELFQPQMPTAAQTAISRNRLQLVHAHVYRRKSIEKLRWTVGLRQSEDIVWIINYATSSKLRWMIINEVVGAWYQHRGTRLSLNRPSGFIHEATANAILNAERYMKEFDMWSSDTSKVGAEAIWDLVHRAFFFRPFFWSNIAKEAIRLDKNTKPDYSIYKNKFLKYLDPRLILWAALPIVFLRNLFRFIRAIFITPNYRRTL